MLRRSLAIGLMVLGGVLLAGRLVYWRYAEGEPYHPLTLSPRHL